MRKSFEKFHFGGKMSVEIQSTQFKERIELFLYIIEQNYMCDYESWEEWVTTSRMKKYNKISKLTKVKRKIKSRLL